ncbi:flagellar motor protein MotB [Nostocoides sp. HKS02]|uniref:OmpA/MotB family protein n=1 Tax=Nostocoides sp. HKS02 TaxID=1813880 RepID=UPI0012B45B6D|nr:flagellar motor protein MotB [Tetrasphaera sp. HKS02]QGN58015.1 OmpA family protein [Tetrasphaera sp. HKS02]
MSAGARPGRAGPGRRRVVEEHDEGHENSERWLLSYADMITLLMALFIVLFAISQVDQAKLIALSSGLDQYFGEPASKTASTGILDGSPQAAVDGHAVSPNPSATGDPIVPSPGGAAAPSAPQAQAGATALSAAQAQAAARAQAARQQQDLAAVRARIAAALAAKGLSGAVQFEERDHGLVVNVVTDRVLFDLGEASLRPEGRGVLDAVVPALRGLPNALTVEGHTDNVPIAGRYASNWELSTERATTVLRYLLTRGVPGSRVSAAGYADQRPLSTNATAAGRARNRRVAIVVHALDTTDPAAQAASAIPSPGD